MKYVIRTIIAAVVILFYLMIVTYSTFAVPHLYNVNKLSGAAFVLLVVVALVLWTKISKKLLRQYFG